MPATTRRVLLAKPRGYCAGVDRAVQAVETALERGPEEGVQADLPIAGYEPLKYGRTPWEIRRPAPTLGQHNAEVFGKQLGLSQARLGELKRKGVI